LPRTQLALTVFVSYSNSTSAIKGVGRKISRGWGGNGKEDRKYQKKMQNSTIKPLPGGGGGGGKRPKNSKKNTKISKKIPKNTMFENLWEATATANLPPAADAHERNKELQFCQREL